jgi:hypothetical protein
VGLEDKFQTTKSNIRRPGPRGPFTADPAVKIAGLMARSNPNILRPDVTADLRRINEATIRLNELKRQASQPVDPSRIDNHIPPKEGETQKEAKIRRKKNEALDMRRKELRATTKVTNASGHTVKTPGGVGVYHAERELAALDIAAGLDDPALKSFARRLAVDHGKEVRRAVGGAGRVSGGGGGGSGQPRHPKGTSKGGQFMKAR